MEEARERIDFISQSLFYYSYTWLENSKTSWRLSEFSFCSRYSTFNCLQYGEIFIAMSIGEPCEQTIDNPCKTLSWKMNKVKTFKMYFDFGIWMCISIRKVSTHKTAWNRISFRCTCQSVNWLVYYFWQLIVS